MPLIAIKRANDKYSWMVTFPGADVVDEVAKWRTLHADYVSHEEVDITTVPLQDDLIEAWEPVGGKIAINMTKAKAIAHDARRRFRDAEMAPLDAEIAKQIPGVPTAPIEAQRAQLRTKYAAAQTAIDAAQTVEEIYSAVVAARGK